LETNLAENRPTILQIIPELDTGGAELSTVEIAAAVVEAGGRALVLSEGGRLAPRISAAGGEFIPFAAATKNPLHILWNARIIARMIEREGVDLVHARSRAPAWSAKLAARRAGVPFVTTFHGAYNEKTRLKRAYNAVMAAGDTVIANSHYTKRLVEERYQTPPERIRVIYRGVDGTVFDPAIVPAQRKAALRAAWRAKPTTRIILQPARLTAWKGQTTVIAAAGILEKEGRLGDSLIVLAGDAQGRDAYRERLEGEIAAAGLGAKVILPGHVDDMPAALAIAHLAVVASVEPEAFGRVATEAQVMGCPVIATDIGAPPETVAAPPRVEASERTGWLVPPGDAPALAGAMAAALDFSPGERSALGARARARVLSRFSLDGMRRDTLDVYDRLLGTGLAAAYGRTA
jgi:glycosyltransferase involved in cell wall biosynthesis